MPDDTTYATDLTLALELARLADEVTTARFGSSDLVVESKPDLSPVSDADRAVETLLRERLGATRPDDAVRGEEYGDTGDSARQWVIDPIDGTKNFVRGVPVWATLISLMDGPNSVVGVVSAPAIGRRWWAHRGGGAFASALGSAPRRLAVSKVAALTDASISYASLGGWKRLGLEPAFVGILHRAWRNRAYGDFWSYMMVAEGAVDVAAEPDLSLWDMAALVPIVTEAGGRFTGLNGVDGPLQGNAVVTNGLLHDAVLDALGRCA